MSVKNATILDRIWLEGTNDYQQRVPQATQQGVAAVAEFLFNPMNKMYYNQFVDALVNRIGMTRINSRIWDNPLSKFKKGNLPYGSTVQDLGIKWIKAHSYRDDLDSLLEVNRPLVEQAFYTLNRRDQYPISTNYDELRNAFVDEYGLNKLINSITDVPICSDNYDEYIIMKQLVSEYESRFGFFKEQISAITNEQTAKDFLVKARAYAGRLKFPSVYYNLVDIPTFASEQELVLFIDPTSLAYVDVQALAAAFNIDKAEIKYRIELIDEWPIPGAVALLTTEDFFQVYDVLYSTTSFYNPQTLTTNYYLNHWEIIAFSPFVPAILFTTEEGTGIDTLTYNVSNIYPYIYSDKNHALLYPTSEPTLSTKYIYATFAGVAPELYEHYITIEPKYFNENNEEIDIESGGIYQLELVSGSTALNFSGSAGNNSVSFSLYNSVFFDKIKVVDNKLILDELFDFMYNHFEDVYTMYAASANVPAYDTLTSASDLYINVVIILQPTYINPSENSNVSAKTVQLTFRNSEGIAKVSRELGIN